MPRATSEWRRLWSDRAEVLTCGCLVHVSVGSDEDGIAAIDRIRVWLQVILAMERALCLHRRRRPSVGQPFGHLRERSN